MNGVKIYREEDQVIQTNCHICDGDPTDNMELCECNKYICKNCILSGNCKECSSISLCKNCSTHCHNCNNIVCNTCSLLYDKYINNYADYLSNKIAKDIKAQIQDRLVQQLSQYTLSKTIDLDSIQPLSNYFEYTLRNTYDNAESWIKEKGDYNIVSLCPTCYNTLL